jgi:hypothetical protein
LPAEFISETNTSTLEVDLREAVKTITYKCTAKDATDNIYLGSDMVIINRGTEEAAGYYYISMTNDNQIFKYDTHGDSPARVSLINPQIINPLSFVLYDPDGQRVEYEEIGASNITWIIPDEDNSMIINAEPMSTYNEKLGFEIKEKYDINANNNTIEIEVFYDNKIIRGKANLIFLKEGENGSNGTSYYLDVLPDYVDGDGPQGRVFYYYRNSNDQGFNFTPRSGAFPFKVLFYKDGEKIYDSSRQSGNVEAEVKFDFLKRIYYTNREDEENPITYKDRSRFVIDEEHNQILCNNYNIATEVGLTGDYTADILRCTFEYQGLVWYYFYPIIFVKYEAQAADYEIQIPESSGFTEVIYTEDGRNPQYKGNNAFGIKVFENLVEIPTNVNWVAQGQIYTSEWQEVANLIADEEDGEIISAIEYYNGNCVTNALYTNINNLIKIHFPIAMYLNVYANEFINE